MSLIDRIDSRSGTMAPRPGETRRSFFIRQAQRRTYVPKAVFTELLALDDRVKELEARLAALEAR